MNAFTSKIVATLCAVTLGLTAARGLSSASMAVVALMMGIILWSIWRNGDARRIHITASQPAPGTDVREAICNRIRQGLFLDRCGTDVFVRIGFDQQEPLLIKWVIEQGYVQIDALKRAVHDGICRQGREMFAWCCDETVYEKQPDHCASPESLGYAIKHDALTKEEVVLIRFERDETPETYIKMADGLLERVMQKLAEGTGFPDLSPMAECAHRDRCC